MGYIFFLVIHLLYDIYFSLVCISVLTRFSETLSKDEKSNPVSIEKQFRKYCKDLKLKDNRFCYFLGGTEDAATGILGEMSKPLSWGMPADKVCEKLKKKDRQICELRYGKGINLLYYWKQLTEMLVIRFYGL